MSRPPATKFYWRDWSVKTAHLETDEYAAYHRLLTHAATVSEDGCSIPGDKKQLRRIIKVSRNRTLAVLDVVLSFFTLRSDGRYENSGQKERLESEANYRESQRLKGKRSSEVRATRVEPEPQPDGQPESNLPIAVAVQPSPSAQAVVADSPLRYESAAPPLVENSCGADNPGLALVRGLAARLDAAPRPKPFPADPAWAWITVTLKPRDPRAAMEFMAWAWKHLTHDLDAIRGMVLEWRDKRIDNPRAYFAATGAGGCRADQAAIGHAEADQRTLKQDTETWLKGAS